MCEPVKTPGPWHLARDYSGYVVGPDDELVIHAHDGTVHIEEDWAGAVIALPALLSTSEAILAWAESGGDLPEALIEQLRVAVAAANAPAPFTPWDPWAPWRDLCNVAEQAEKLGADEVLMGRIMTLAVSLARSRGASLPREE